MKIYRLTLKEKAILALLKEAQGPVSAREIYERVWQEKYLPPADNAVAVHISHLRRKLGDGASIKTLWGIGYQWIEEKKE